MIQVYLKNRIGALSARIIGPRDERIFMSLVARAIKNRRSDNRVARAPEIERTRDEG
jgi:hypothetical protein